MTINKNRNKNNKKTPNNDNEVEVFEVKMFIDEEYRSRVLNKIFLDILEQSFDFTIYNDSKNTIKINANSIDEARAVSNILEYIYRGVVLCNNYDNFVDLFIDELYTLIKEALIEVGPATFTNNSDAIFKDFSGRFIIPRTANQADIAESIRTNVITVARGCSGTGKSKIAICMALKFLYNNRFDRILIVRPMLTVGKDVGYLPGSIDEKYGPYASPVTEAIVELVGEKEYRNLIDYKKIILSPVAFVRGANFKNSIVIIDEAQNLTKVEIFTLLTRLCYNGKIIITGDESQDDRKFTREASGLEVVCDKLKDVDGVGIITMGLEDIQRHKILKDIISRFEED